MKINFKKPNLHHFKTSLFVFVSIENRFEKSLPVQKMKVFIFKQTDHLFMKVAIKLK
jgi:hypothetical protein